MLLPLKSAINIPIFFEYFGENIMLSQLFLFLISILKLFVGIFLPICFPSSLILSTYYLKLWIPFISIRESSEIYFFSLHKQSTKIKLFPTKSPIILMLKSEWLILELWKQYLELYLIFLIYFSRS